MLPLAPPPVVPPPKFAAPAIVTRSASRDSGPPALALDEQGRRLIAHARNGRYGLPWKLQVATPGSPPRVLAEVSNHGDTTELDGPRVALPQSGAVARMGGDQDGVRGERRAGVRPRRCGEITVAAAGDRLIAGWLDGRTIRVAELN